MVGLLQGDMQMFGGPLVDYEESDEVDSRCGVAKGLSETGCLLPHESPVNHPLPSGKSHDFNFSIHESSSSPIVHYCTGSSQSFVPQSTNMMECHGLKGEADSRRVLNRVMVLREAEGDGMMWQESVVVKGADCGQCLVQVEDEESEDDVDVMMDKMGLTVSDGDGNAVKLSKFLSLKGRKGTRAKTSTIEE